MQNNNGIPIFPAGVVKIYQNPNPPIISNIDNLNYVQQNDYPDTTQFGSESSNIVEIDELKELKVWFEDCIKDYFDNVMTLSLIHI